MHIILASASPRRRELLQQIGWEFEVCVSDVVEKITKTLPWEVVEELSYQKAEDVFVKTVADRKREAEAVLVIGADTIVVCDGQILGKPKDRQDAISMITMLQGRSHHVYTGVTLMLRTGSGTVRSCSFHEETEVTFYPMTRKEIEIYVGTGELLQKTGNHQWNTEEMMKAGWLDECGNWKTDNGCHPTCMDKAGAYGIQGLCARYISGIRGDYNNVVGLPVGRLYQEVKALYSSIIGKE